MGGGHPARQGDGDPRRPAAAACWLGAASPRSPWMALAAWAGKGAYKGGRSPLTTRWSRRERSLIRVDGASLALQLLRRDPKGDRGILCHQLLLVRGSGRSAARDAERATRAYRPSALDGEWRQ